MERSKTAESQREREREGERECVRDGAWQREKLASVVKLSVEET
jgi:hypothetical protein